jgi:DNA-3-methyladenine glycosylase II
MNKRRVITIPVSEDFNFSECYWFLDRNYDDCLHRLKEGRIIKALRVNDQPVLLSIRVDADRLLAEVLHVEKNGEGLEEGIRGYLSAWLDMDRDLSAFYGLLRKDKRLAYMPDQYRGLRLVGVVDLFESLCWSVIGQQINLRFAYTLKRRLVERYGRKLVYEGETYHLFPDPTALAMAKIADLRDMQFSERKAAYLIGLAGVFARGELSREILAGLPDLESRQQALMQLKGVGVWTANYCLMKTLREPSCIPYGDTGLLTALANHGVIKDRKEEGKINRFFKQYAGWESYLVFYLWRSLSERVVKDNA